jgi:flagellar motor switch protein FliN
MPDEIKQDVAAEDQSQAEAQDAASADAVESEAPAQRQEEVIRPIDDDEQPQDDDADQNAAENADADANDEDGADENDDAADGSEGVFETVPGLESRQDLEDEFPDLSSVKVEETMAHPAEFQQLSVSASDRRSTGNIDLLLDVKMPIAIELGRTEMPISEILSLGPGSVVELDKLAGEPVDLLVNGKIVARGEVVVVDENFGVRITMLMSPKERLKSLAQ